MMTRTLTAIVLVGALSAPVQSQKQDSIVTVAKRAIAIPHDTMSLKAGGWGHIGFNAKDKDLTPFQGEHWISIPRFAANAPVDLAQPTFLMYLPVADTLVPVGVAYARRVPAAAELPVDLAGDKAEWHSHVFCRNIPGEGQALADGLDDCKERGGTPNPNQIAMVHTWTVPNPDGAYAHDNPALPFLATGLTPPAHAGKDERLLGVALGETYGARLVIAHRITIEATRAGKAQALEPHRAKLRDLAAQLRAAEKSRDAKKAEALKKGLVEAYGALADEYRALAATPEMKARFEVELGQATGAMAHHHM